MENSVGTFRTDRLMQGDRPSQVTVNTGSTVYNSQDHIHIYINNAVQLHYNIVSLKLHTHVLPGPMLVPVQAVEANFLL